MSNIDWSSAPEWATKHGIVGTYREHPIWFNDTQYTYCDEQQEGKVFNFSAGCVYKPKEIYAITERPAPQWPSEGLPPVGTECEIAASTEYLKISYPEGAKVKIYAHFKHDCGREFAAFVDSNCQVYGIGMAKVFRPVKTPSQIAAELRTTTIKRAAELCPFPRADSTLVVLEALYDNGILKGDAK